MAKPKAESAAQRCGRPRWCGPVIGIREICEPMGKKSLIITEKPSVARDIVQALGGFTARGKDYWERDDYLVSFAVGHLLELLPPEDISPAYRRWSLELLPILPHEFQLRAVAGQKGRLAVLGRLMDRDDVHCLINACDAAREGELIFREIVQFHGCRKWVRRLWLQSMTAEAIRDGFSSLRDGTDLDGLGAAAASRAQADWLIGMNGTRAFSECLRARGERVPWSVGRVQTPTLALLVERELEVLRHRSRPYWQLTASFAAADHTYEGRWFDGRRAATARHDGAADSGEGERDDRLFSREDVERIRAQVLAAPASSARAAEMRDRSRRAAPRLFNLTGLQRTMAQRYKWTARRTLEAAQRCYESHKVLTYPRTSSSCLPQDYRGQVDRLLAGLTEDRQYGAAAQRLVGAGLCNIARTFDDKGVSDHFAIIPTGRRRALTGDDSKLFDAVMRRFLANFHPPAVYDRVRRVTTIAGQTFRTGPIETLVSPGWLEVYGQGSEAPDGDAVKGDGAAATGAATRDLPPLVQPAPQTAGDGSGSGEVMAVADHPVRFRSLVEGEERTKPPPRLGEAALLSLMEHAGRRVADEEMARALQTAEGLGTAATRADIIQNLKLKEYVDGDLRPTFKGIHLIRTLKLLGTERLTSPELTGKLELDLAEVEAGRRPRSAFMAVVTQYVQDLVAQARAFDHLGLYRGVDPIGLCPLCRAAGQQAQVRERLASYQCESVGPGGGGCGLVLPKDIMGRYLDPVTAAELIQRGETAVITGFGGPVGPREPACLRLVGGELELSPFSGSAQRVLPAPRPGRAGAQRRGRKSGPERAGGAARPSIGPCPMHREQSCQVVETKGAYVCEQRLAAFAAGSRDPTGIMIPKVLCQRPVTPEEVERLLARGSLPELRGFVSKAGRPFTAALVLDPTGRVTFNFPPRNAAANRADGPNRKSP